MRSIFADDYQLSFLISNSGISSQGCEDAAVAPVAYLQWQEASIVLIQDQPHFARIRPEAAAVDNDRSLRFHGKLLADCIQTEIACKYAEFRYLPRNARMVTKNEICYELLRLIQLRRLWVCQPLQLELGCKHTLPATRLLQTGKTLLELLVKLLYLPAPVFIQILSPLQIGLRH